MAAATGLIDDEAYYRLWSLAPALSYFDHPPMVAWLIACGRWLGGDTAFGVRLLGPVLFAGGALLLWRMTTLLEDRSLAPSAVAFYFTMPLLMIGGVVMTPDTPSVLFYGLTLLALLELDKSQNARWWLAIGVLAGLGCVSKYTNLFLGATILIWILAVPANRRWLASPQLWTGGAIAALITLPVLVWNAQHEWASFVKQFGRIGRGSELGPKHLLELIAGYLVLLSPVIAILSISGLATVTRRAIKERGSRDVLLSAAVVPPLLYFVAHSFHARVQPNWLAPLYPLLALCAAIGLRNYFGEPARRWVQTWAMTIGAIEISLIFAHALHPIVAVDRDPVSQLRGWEQFASSLNAVMKDEGATWVTTSSYATTGQLSFAFRGRVPVTQLDQAIRYENLPALPAALKLQPALYVELDRRENRALAEWCFTDVQKLMSLSRADGSSSGAHYAVYLVSAPTGQCPSENGSWRGEAVSSR